MTCAIQKSGVTELLVLDADKHRSVNSLSVIKKLRPSDFMRNTNLVAQKEGKSEAFVVMDLNSNSIV